MSLANSVVSEALLNRGIQKYLKPEERNMKEILQIIFDPEAKVAEHIDSVIKVWRIKKPNYIEVCDENLIDEHIIKFADLLQDHLSHIRRIILRRNLIGDAGAEALAKFIARNEKDFTYLEISRNRISDKGATKILEALRKNTRLTTMLIDFGNDINHRLARKLEAEVKANGHIESLVRGSLIPDNNESFCKLSIRDKGREFLRCALKSVEMLNILELELCDNLLAFPEARKIAYILR